MSSHPLTQCELLWLPPRPPTTTTLHPFGWSAKTLWSQISVPVLTHYYSDNMARRFWYRLIHSVSRTLSFYARTSPHVWRMSLACFLACACRSAEVACLSAVLVLWCLHSGFAFLCFLCPRRFVCVCVCVCLPKKEILILQPSLQQHQSGVRMRRTGCLSLCVYVCVYTPTF